MAHVFSYEPVSLPSGAMDASTDDIAAGIHGWIASAPMRDLVTAYGDSLPDLPTAELLAWLDAFSSTWWDFRARAQEANMAAHAGTGVERDQVTGFEFRTEVATLVRMAATALSLVEPRPVAQPSYDHLLVLGGLAPACLQRTAYAATCLRNGVSVHSAAALGSFRPLGGHEKFLLIEPADYEVDAMEIGVRRAFGFTEPVERRGSRGDVNRLSWRIDTYQHPSGPRVDVLAAPAETGQYRANTPDTYKFWAEGVKLQAHDRVLVITSPIYVPFQHSDAIRMLHVVYGCSVETVGLDGNAIDGAPPLQAFSPDRYLQEIRSGIRSMQNLYTAMR